MRELIIEAEKDKNQCYGRVVTEECFSAGCL